LEHSFNTKAPFKLLLLDYFMPSMDGFEVMAEIQKYNCLKERRAERGKEKRKAVNGG